MIIAFTGPISVGKSTLAHILQVHFNFTRVRFAGPLKAMLRAIGLTEQDTDGRTKEQPHHLLCGRTPRYAMQRLGTEWGRDLIGDNLWVDLWKFNTQQALLGGASGVVCDDCRFENEAATTRAMGGHVVHVERNGIVRGEHASEAGVARADTDRIFYNNAPLDAARAGIETFLLPELAAEDEHRMSRVGLREPQTFGGAV